MNKLQFDVFFKIYVRIYFRKASWEQRIMYQYPARLVSNVMKTKSRKTQVIIPVHLTWEDKQGENSCGVQMLLRILFSESNYDEFRCF